MDFRRIRINEQIRAREVRLIDENGGQMGVVQTQQALRQAQEINMDLVEISPQANPPVCKIMDFSKFKYQQEKRDKELRRNQRLTEMKEIYIRPSISEHDLFIKLNHVREFLTHGHVTKIVIRFRGREMEFFRTKLDALLAKIDAAIQDVGNRDRPNRERNSAIMVVTPKRRAPGTSSDAKPAEPRAPASATHPSATPPAKA